MSPLITPEKLAELLEALKAGGWPAAPNTEDPVERLEAHARQHQQECWCDIKDLLSTGHSPGCPERVVRELQK